MWLSLLARPTGQNFRNGSGQNFWNPQAAEGSRFLEAT